MAILGIYDGHNACAAMVSERSGKILAAVEEERFSRIKNHDSRRPDIPAPVESIRYCVTQADEPITTVALALEAPADLHRSAINSYVESVRSGELERLRASEYHGKLLNGYGLFDLPRSTQEQRIQKVLDALRMLGVPDGAAIAHFNHHDAHAASVFLTIPADEALIITMDGKGDGLSGLVATGSGHILRPLARTDYWHSLGHLYAACTVVCGFTAIRHEGKVTALAASGEVDQDLYQSLSKLFEFDVASGTIRGNLNRGLPMGPYPHTIFGGQIERLRSLAGDRDRANIAATVQDFTEKIICSLAEHYLGTTGPTALALAGGLFANVSVNRRLLSLDNVTDLYVHPAMSDAGLAVGAALLSYVGISQRRPEPLRSAFLGPEFDPNTAAAQFRAGGYHVVRPRSAELLVAKALARGFVVARFDGRAEYGPRALGNRSILAPANDPTLPARLNNRLRRSDIMPFAPATLIEHSSALYSGIRRAQWSSEFMTVALACSAKMLKQSPAAVHIDNTARPQVVRAEVNPGLFGILSHYHNITGQPSIINTSFNLHEEPMVLSPEDALRSAVVSRLELVQLGPYVCSRSATDIEMLLAEGS